MPKELETVEASELDLSSKQYGFHFTNLDTRPNTIPEVGIIGKIGSNSTGALGGEAIPKPFFSVGLEGMLQTYNRTLNIALDMPVAGFNQEHMAYIPESAKTKSGNERLSTEEAFIFMKNYFGANTYLVFEAPRAEYEFPISQEQLDEINKQIRASKDYQLIDELDSLKEEGLDDISGLSKREISKLVRHDTLVYINQLRGDKVSDGLYDEVDYNEERLEWLIQPPNNTHTRIVVDNDGIHGIPIRPEGIRRIVSNGQKDTISAVRALFEKRDKSKPYGLRIPRQYDVGLIEAFLDYTSLPEDLSVEEKEAFFSTIEKYRNITYRSLRAEQKGVPQPEFTEEETEFLGDNGIARIHEIAEGITASRTAPEASINIETITSNAIATLDNGLVPIEDYVREADRTKRKIREERAIKSQGDSGYLKNE